MALLKYKRQLYQRLPAWAAVVCLLSLSTACGMQPKEMIGDASTYTAEDGSSEAQIGDASSFSSDENTDGESEDPKGETAKAVNPADCEALHVDGTNLKDADGNIVNLRGVSTHGIGVYPEYVNPDAFKTLRDDWGANLIRLAMYTQVENGYLDGGDQAAQRATIDNGVKYATDLGMYVIIDWHILTDGNPYQHKDEAVRFFSDMSKKYADHANVIYEICNEPQNSPWSSVIKPYAEEVIPVIRENDDDAVILVGTNTWSQDINEVTGSRLDDKNVMYVVHFYAASHGDYLRDRVQNAIDSGVPVFISECSICDASGNGGIDYDSAEKWLSMIEQEHIPYVVWNLSNKNESSAVIRPDCSKLSGWSESELSDTGKWFRNRMQEERSE